MHKAFSLLQIIICVFGSIVATGTSSVAQITGDGTLNTQVERSGNVTEITGGETAENNVFHSFEQFSIPANREAFFNNAENIINIFSRVTGGNTSNIDGAIRANGSASLFLVNPAGIVFGEGASLNIGGSFYGSTGSGILFENGEFSATDLENSLITVNAPIGLNLRSSSAQIINRSQFEATAPDDVSRDLPNFDFNLSTPVGLQVNQGESIVLEAGSILFDGGLATAPGGSISLKAIDDVDIVGETQTGFLTRSNSLNTSVEEGNGGVIDINSVQGSISISNTDLSSALSTSASFDLAEDNDNNIAVSEGSGGNIMINAQANVNLNNSFLDSTSDSSTGRGLGGNVLIRGANVRLEDTRIDAASFSDGRSGDITIEAVEGGNIELIGSNTEEQIDIFESGGATGFTTESEAAIFVDAYGGGDETESQTGGDLIITGGSITIENYNLISRVNEFSDRGILLNPITTGDAGDIIITGNQIRVDNSSLVTATLGDGNAGNIELNTNQDIAIANGAELNTRTLSLGSAGVITIDANSLSVDNSAVEASNLPPEATLENVEVFAGNINLNLNQNLVLKNDSTISAVAEESANGGNIAISSEFIIAFPAQVRGSDIVASADAGRGGNINIQTESILGIAESPISTDNNINASSNLSGLDGTVSITNSNVNAIGEAAELASNVIDVNDVMARACSVDNNTQSSTLSLKDRVRNPPGINEPFISENIDFASKDAAAQTTPVKIVVAKKQIVLAQGIIIKENGEVELTGKSSSEQKPRYRSRNCQ